MKGERRMLPDERSGVSVRTERRAAEDGELLEGLASVFYDGTRGTEFELWPGIVERIQPGAFDEALAGPDDVRALFNHDPNLVLGRNVAGTLELSVDKIGLRYSVALDATQVAEDVRAHVMRGDVSGSSFAFMIRDGGVEWSEEEIEAEGGRTLTLDVRNITKVRLLDVSPVTYPAYEAATVEAKAAMRDGYQSQVDRAKNDELPDGHQWARELAEVRAVRRATKARELEAEARSRVADADGVPRPLTRAEELEELEAREASIEP